MGTFDYSVINTGTAADATVSAKKASITGIAKDIKLSLVRSYTKTAYAAGTASIDTVQIGAALSAAGTVTLRISQGGVERAYSYTGASGATASTIASALKDRIDADGFAIVSATVSTDTLTLTLTADALAGGEPSFEVDGVSATIADPAPTPYVAPAGTPALVEAELNPEDVSDVSASGQYAEYVIVYDELERDNIVNGQRIAKQKIVKLFIDETASDYADLDARLSEIFEGTKDDATLVGGLGLKYEAVALSTSYDFEGTAGLLNVTSVNAGNDDINLPSTTALPIGYSCIVKNGDGANTFQLVADSGASDTIDGGASIDVAAGEVFLITITAANTWISIQLA